MAIKVRVMNCQSIRDAVIVIDGFTVITGPNNSGKTAFMRALRAPFINGSVGALVRHGAEDMVVGIDFGEGKSLVFKKGKTKPTYVINGGKPIHPGGSVPDELAELGVFPLDVGGDKLWPQIATQFSDGKFSGPIFLLDKPGRIMAEVVADVERVGRLSKAMKLCDSDRRKATDQLKVRKTDRAKIEAELDKFLGLDSVVAAMGNIETLLQEIVQVGTSVQALRDLEARHQAREGEVVALRGVGAVSVPSAKLVEEATSVAQQVQALSRLETRHTAASVAVQAVQGVSGVPVPGTERLSEATTVGKEVLALASLDKRLSEARGAVNKLAGVGGLEVPAVSEIEAARTLGTTLGELTRLEGRLTKAQGEVRAREAARDAAHSTHLNLDLWEQAERVIQGLDVLVEMQTKLAKAQMGIQQAQQALAATTAELETARAELVEVMGQVEVCPTCRTPMGETHLHEEVA